MTRPRDELTDVLRRQRSRIALAVLLMAITAVAGVALLGLSGGFLTATALAGAVGLGSGFNFFSPAAGIRALTLVRIVSRYVEKLVSHDTTLRLARALRVWFFARALPLAPQRLGGQRMGDVLARVMSDSAEVDGTLVRAWGPLCALAALTACAVAAAAWLHAPAGAVLAVWAATLGLALPCWTQRRAAEQERQRANARGAWRAQVFEGLEGLADLTALDARAAWHDRVVAQARQLAQHDGQRRRRLLVAQGLHGLLAGWGVVAMLAVGLAAVQAGQLQAPQAAALVFLTVATLELLAGVSQAWQAGHAARAAATRLRELTDADADACGPPLAPAGRGDAAEPGVEPRLAPRGLAGQDGALHTIAQAEQNAEIQMGQGYGPESDELKSIIDGYCETHMPRTLCLSQLTFSHPGQPSVLRGLSLCLAPGERVAIRGDSGCGKSTLSELVLGLWPPQQGSVSWGGVDLRELDVGWWHAQIAWLPQGAPVFAGTVADNLRLGDPQASDARLWQVLSEVNLADWARQAEGLATWVGENGATLSAGQARRLALARALLRRAPLMVLDEPTEGLDVDTAAAVMQDLTAALAGRSLLVITHAPLPPGVVQRELWLRDGRLSPQAA